MGEYQEKYFLGIDIGGSAIKFGWGNRTQGLMYSAKKAVYDTGFDGISLLLKQILDMVDTSIGLDRIFAIGVGTPGNVDFKTGRIAGVNPNLPGWTDIDVKTAFPKNLKQQLYVDNDANLMALAEAGFHRASKVVLGVTIGSGIGSGLIIDGDIYHGAHGFAGEIGHSIVVPAGDLCNCGRHGCLEAYASVNGLINRLKLIQPEAEAKNMVDIINLAKCNIKVNDVLESSINHLSTTLSNAATLLDLDCIVLGGGVIELESYPFKLIREKTLDLLPDTLKNKIVVEKAQLGNQAGIMGAIILSERQITEF